MITVLDYGVAQRTPVPSVVDPDPHFGRLDPDPDPEGQKWTIKQFQV
jgi:hypothetical protein